VLYKLHNIRTKNHFKKLSQSIFVKTVLWISLLFGQFSVVAQRDSVDAKLLKFKSKAKSGIQVPVDYSAEDSMVLDIPGKKVYLYGNAKVRYEDINLDAGYIMVDFNTQGIIARPYNDASGKLVHRPHFSDGKDQFTSDSMNYNFSSKKALVFNARTTQQDGFVFGEKTFKDPQNNTYIKNARYTTCNDTVNPHFYIFAKKFKIIPNKQAITGPANLVIAGINTPLLVPFGFFPLQKGQTRGVIFPTYGESQDRGFFLRNLGYYFPINKYYDLAVTADIFFRGSYGIHLNSSYAKRYKFRGNVGFDYNYNEFGEKETGITISKDYTIKWNYNSDAKSHPGQTFNANINYVSSNYNKNNSFTQQNIIQSTIQSSANYSRSFLSNNLNMSLGSRIVQNLQREEVNITFPEMSLNVPRISPFANLNTKNKAIKTLGLSYNGDFLNSVVMKQKNLVPALGLDRNNDSIHIADSLKSSIVQSVPISASIKLFKYFQLNPTASFTEYWYFKSELQSWDNVNDTLLTTQKNGFERASSIQASMSFLTTLFGMLQFKKGKLQAVRLVLTPSLNFGFRPDLQTYSNGFRKVQIDTLGTTKDYSIFGNSGSAYPSGVSSASIGFNINNNLEIKTRKHTDTGYVSKKIKLIEMFNISSAYNLVADSFNWSNFSFNGRSTLFKSKLSVNYSWTIDPYQYTNRRINKLVIDNGKNLGRLTGANLSMGTNFNKAAREKKVNANTSNAELMMINTYPQYYVDFSIPWSLQVNYNLIYTHADPRVPSEVRQSVTFNGDVKLTENWKIGYGSGYDFFTKQLAITKIDIHRDLHCWEFSFGWIPVGFRQSFEFRINVKASSLQDLKLSRRNFWYDN